MQNQNIGIGTAAIGRPQYINIRTVSSVPTPATEIFPKEDFKAEGRIVLNAAYE